MSQKSTTTNSGTGATTETTSGSTTNQNELKGKKGFTTLIIVIIVVVLILVLLYAYYLIGGASTVYSIHQISGVFIAAVVSGIITILLLYFQTEILKAGQENAIKREVEWRDEDQKIAEKRREKDQEFEEHRIEKEEKRSKSVQIYSNKIAAFSAFNEAVWSEKEEGQEVWDLDSEFNEDKKRILKKIRTTLFSKAVLYLSADEIKKVEECIGKPDENKNILLPVILSRIVAILNENAEKTLEGKEKSERGMENTEKYQNACKGLWNAFSEWINLYDSEDAAEEETTEHNDSDQGIRKLKPEIQPWHFCMWDTTQLKSLENGLEELSLVEYGVSWRTNLVKQVKSGDLVFLFRGNKKYSGVFKAKGWRVFEYSTKDQERYVREIVSDKDIQKVTGEEEFVKIDSVERQLSKHDFYGSFKDGSTSCANVIVESISFFPDGVPNPNTTYRKTISRYDRRYAVRLLENFAEEERNKNDENKDEKLKKINACMEG